MLRKFAQVYALAMALAVAAPAQASVSNTASLVEYTGNGATTAFPIPFPYSDPTYIQVRTITPTDVEAVLVYGVGYTVSAAGSSGTATLTSAPASGYTVRIQRVVPLTQPIAFRTQGPFSPTTWEAALDRLQMQIQQINDGALVASSYTYDHGNQPGGSLHAAVTATTNGFATPSMLASITGLPTTYKSISYVPTWTEITSKPTTLTGYGLRVEADGLYKPLSYVPTWASITSKPTTLAGYGITDAHGTTVTWAEISGKPTTAVATLDGLNGRVTTLESAGAPSLRAEARFTWNGTNYSNIDKWDPGGILPGIATKPGTGQAKVTFATSVPSSYRVSVYAAGTTVGDNKLAVALNLASRNATDFTAQFWNVQAVATADVSEFHVEVFY